MTSLTQSIYKNIYLSKLTFTGKSVLFRIIRNLILKPWSFVTINKLLKRYIFCFPIIILTASSSISAPLSGEIEEFTGGRTKIIWARGVNDNIDSDLSYVSYQLMGYDSHDGQERILVNGPISCANPWITSDGQRIVYTSWPDNQVYIADWSGENLLPLVEGYGLYVWNDPETKREWIYYSDFPYGTVIYRSEIDNISRKELIWNKTKVSIRFRVSADGTRGGGEFPWSSAGEVLLPNQSFQQYGSGCNAQIAPDNSYRFFVLQSGHQALHFCDFEKTNCRQISVNSILSSQTANAIWAPKWSNKPRFITCTAQEYSGTNDIYLGKFNESYTDIEQWIPITDDGNTFDNYAYAWIGNHSHMSFSTDSLYFELDLNSQKSSSQFTFIQNTHSPLSQLTASTTASWLSFKVTHHDNQQSIENIVSAIDLPSGIYSTTVIVTGENMPSEQYKVILRVNSSSQASSINILPCNPQLPCSSSIQFSAQVYDQFNTKLDHTVIWSCDSGGTISENGLFQSNGRTGTFIINAYDSENNTLCETTSITVCKDLIITSPSDGMSFNTGDTITLQWTGKPANLQGVTLSLSLNGGRTWMLLNNQSMSIDDPDWGNFTWTVPDSIITDNGILSCTSSRCKIKIANYNECTAGNFFSSGHFSINTTDIKPIKNLQNRNKPKLIAHIRDRTLLLYASSEIRSVKIYSAKGECVKNYNAQTSIVKSKIFQLSSGYFIIKAATLNGTFFTTCVVH